jgi:predicted dehydrogenase
VRPPLRLGLIGCGRVSQLAHLPALAKTTSVTLVAICDSDRRRAERVARRFSVERSSSDPDALLADDRIDAVIIAVPDRMHVPLTERALSAGKHVLVEKPLGLTAEESSGLRAALAGTGLKLQVAAMKRHDPGVEYAKKYVCDQLGQAVSCHAWYRASSFKADWHATMAPKPIDPETPDHGEGKTDPERYYLATHGAHLFDEIRFLLGGVSHVTARYELTEGIHVWHGIIELAAGGLVHFELVVSLPAPWAEGFTVYGSRGNLSIDTHFPFLLRASDVRAFNAEQREWAEPVFGDTDPYKRQLDAFARAIVDDLPTCPDLEDGIAALDVIEAVAQSVHTGQRVSVNG